MSTLSKINDFFRLNSAFIPILTLIVIPVVIYVILYAAALTFLSDPTLFILFVVIVLMFQLLGDAYLGTTLPRRVPGYVILLCLLIMVSGLAVVSYSAVSYAVFNLGFVPSNPLASLLGLSSGYETHIWFSLGSFQINYSLVRITVTLFSICGIIVAIVKFGTSKLHKN